MRLIKNVLCITLIVFSMAANAEEFLIKNIKVSGIKRISLGTVLSYLPVKEGETIDTSETDEIIQALYKTGFFSDISVKIDGNTLLVHVSERSVIGSMKITGNSKITKKQMLESLKAVGFFEGQALDPSLLHAIKNAIIQQYYNLGMYDAKVDVSIKPEERNRAAVYITIVEGPKAKIKSIEIIGNKAFSKRALLKDFSLTTTKLWSFLTNSDQYSKEKLEADIEKLRSYYMDRGYLSIKVDSTKVSISPNKKGIYIKIYITEGGVYKFSGFSLEGDLIGKRAEILKLITIKNGDIFSRKQLFAIQAKISEFLAEYGYGVADINIDWQTDKNTKKAWIKFTVNPGHRMYVRHIDFEGNYKTNDEVLRREMRLQEGGVFALSKIAESKRRLANLGYLQDIEHRVAQVPDSNNQVDLFYKVKEVSAISLGVRGGYSDQDGFLYGANILDQNFLGTGRSVSLSFDNTKATQNYSFSYYNPYFTADKIGFSISGYMRKSNLSRQVDLSSYRFDTYGMQIGFDMPTSEYSSLSYGLGFEHIILGTTGGSSAQVLGFVNRLGSVFDQIKLLTSWSYSNIDRAFFPTKGFANSISLEGYAPANKNSLFYYKTEYSATYYQPIYKDFIWRLSTELGYGDGIGKAGSLPFYKSFYAGGLGTVRGFEADTLSEDRDSNGKALGGNVMTVASTGIILPSPMETLRPTVFVDVGNVYTNKFKAGDLRASYGIQLEWRTPLVPIVFSYAKPLRKKAHDQLHSFQFSISAGI